MAYSSSSTAYSVAVIGAGIAGLATGVALARQGLKVCMIAPMSDLPDLQTDVFDLRVYAISPSSQAFLSSLGIWESIPKQRITAVTDMQIFGDAAAAFVPQNTQARTPALQGTLHLSAWQSASEQLTWIVESREIERALRQAARVVGVEWMATKCQHWEAQQQGWQLHLENGQVLQADLIVGADGTNSWVREKAGIPVQEVPYDHIGLIGHFTTEKPHQGRAYQWFGPDGILAFLPMPDTQEGAQVSIVWSMTTKKANHLLGLSQEELVQCMPQALATVSQGVLGEMRLRISMQGFPLKKKIVDSMTIPGIVLVGDAAHQVHPMAGQGLNLGLGDVACLSRILGTRAPVRSVSDPLLLARYARERAEPVWAMRMLTDGLYHALHPRHAPLKAVANLGMQVLNQLPPIKRFLVKKAF